MSPTNSKNPDHEKLKKRKKAGKVLAYLLFAIATVDLLLLIFKLQSTSDIDRNLIIAVIIPLLMGLLLLNGVNRIDRDLKNSNDEGNAGDVNNE